MALELRRLYKDDPEVLYHGGRLFSNFAYLHDDEAPEVAPDSVWMHQAAGEANESLRNYDAALEEYQKVLALAPGRPGIHYRIGRVSWRARGRRRRRPMPRRTPRREFEEELAIDPTNADAAYELGELHRKSGELDKARELFAAPSSTIRTSRRASSASAVCSSSQGKAELALAPLKKAVALNPKDDVAHFQIYQAYRALGQGGEAQKAQAEFQRLRAQKREAERRDLLRAHVVTQQELDAELKTTPP